jgi:basic membrane protein A
MRLRNPFAKEEGTMKIIRYFTLVIALSLFLVVFEGSAVAAGKEKLSIAVNTIGASTDMAWSQAILEAYLNIKRKYPKAKVTFTEHIPFAEGQAVLESQLETGVDVIYMEDAWYDVIRSLAPRFPKTQFIEPCLPEERVKGLSPNITSYGTRDEEGGYLAGVAAGMLTKTNKLGYIAGADYPLIIKTGKGFELGAKSVNPKAELLVAYTGDWVDIQKGYETAKTLIDLGVDVILHYADNAGKGVIKAAQERGVYVVGEALDQYDLAPNLMVTSFIINHTRLLEEAMRDYTSGKIRQWAKWYGIREGEPGIAPMRDNVPDDVKVTVNKVKAKILTGELVVPVVIDPKQLKRLK